MILNNLQSHLLLKQYLLAYLLNSLALPVGIKLKVELDFLSKGFMAKFAALKHVFHQIINLNVFIPPIVHLHEIAVFSGIVLSTHRRLLRLNCLVD